MPNYLKEAFKELELLNEETFSFDKDGAAELKKFYDGDTTDDYESIIDPEAETKDELEDSYEGKVIVACKICHGMQYKDPQDIVIDEESDYVNVGEECPACSAVDGFKIVGQVAPYCAECENEHKEGETEVDDDETDIEEALDEKRKASRIIESLKSAPKRHFKESLNEEKNKYLGILRNELGLTGAKSMDNKDYRYYMFSVPKDKRTDELLKEIEDKIPDSKAFYDERGALKVRIEKDKLKEALNEEKLTTLFDVVGGMLDGTMDRITINKKTGKKQAVGTKTPYDAEEDIGVDDDGYFVWVADEAGAKYAQEVADKFRLKTKLDAPTKYIRGSKNRKFHIYIPESRYDEPVEQVIEESCGKLKEGYDRDILIHDILSKLEQEGYDVRGRDARTYADGAAELIMIAPDGYTVDKWFEDTKMNYPEDLLRFKKFSDLKESVENITVETDSDTIKVEPSEDGKVEVKTEPKEKDEKSDEEMIVPVSAETKDEIDMNDTNFDETDVDIDIDSIDDEGFDTLGESYLKKVYENVESFKTSSSSIKDGKLMVEGIISFNSGKKAKTSFVFESISKTKRGKIKFLGENLNFSKSKSAFTLIAKPEGKKAVCESLTYNYVAKDSKSNKKLPVYGKVSK